METLLYQKSKYEKLLLQEEKQKPITAISLLSEWQNNRANFIQEKGVKLFLVKYAGLEEKAKENFYEKTLKRLNEPQRKKKNEPSL